MIMVSGDTLGGCKVTHTTKWCSLWIVLAANSMRFFFVLLVYPNFLALVGIAPLTFESLRVISYPGGQQYGAISPCEMNEFSDECEAWEVENGPYQKGEFMVRSNPRTKGR
jgi:hypothetical protein